MIQTHPYIALVASFIVGYGIINYTTPNKAQPPPTKKPDTTATASTTPPKTEQFFGAAEQSQYPAVNPLAGISLQERTGVMNPVRWNKTTDVRGEPKGVRNQTMPVESSFLKNPRAVEARIDESEVKHLRKQRQIEY